MGRGRKPRGCSGALERCYALSKCPSRYCIPRGPCPTWRASASMLSAAVRFERGSNPPHQDLTPRDH